MFFAVFPKARSHQERTAGLPLPAGEGRGEGERGEYPGRRDSFQPATMDAKTLPHPFSLSRWERETVAKTPGHSPAPSRCHSTGKGEKPCERPSSSPAQPFPVAVLALREPRPRPSGRPGTPGTTQRWQPIGAPRPGPRRRFSQRENHHPHFRVRGALAPGLWTSDFRPWPSDLGLSASVSSLIQRTAHADARLGHHMRVNHRRADIPVPE